MILSISEILLYLAIPISSGLVGWGTNILAIKMTFYPVEAIGIRPFVWQGIIPSKALKIANKSVDLLTGKLLKIDEQFAKIEPHRVAQEIQTDLKALSRRIINEAMEAQAPRLWEKLPDSLKQTAYERVSEELPEVVVLVLQDVKTEIKQILDLKTLTIKSLTQNKALLNEIFIRCGREEFRFIERSGIYFGTGFGIIQMFVCYFYNPWWLLPAFGLLIGYATNYLAINLIFRPLKPRYYFFGKIKVQGLFLKRQHEVADEYAGIITEEILTTRNIFDFMLRGPGSAKFAQIVRSRVVHAIDDLTGSAKPIINIWAEKELAAIKNIAVYRFLEELPLTLRASFPYAEEALNMREMLRTKMKQLTPTEFVSFLRPAFQEDEWILILVGAILGMLAGIMQFILLFL
ncbi:MAG: hypothetical protein JJT94_15370 [Bernardetiaceae bacterium]|nr:hypothetical protein [Bernardetiaceae bacterium]